MTQQFPFPVGKIHIIGIGGIGMSGYAEVLHHMGYKVQGADMAETANVTRLRRLGLRIAVGHAAENILDEDGKPCAIVVRSSAIGPQNAEVRAAAEAGIRVIDRVELLAELMQGNWCVNVAGTHGKTTTTALVGHVLDTAGLDPSILNGGIMPAYGSNIRVGKSRWMVVEADESDGTFARLPSVVSVVTNIDPEHMETYGGFDAVKAAYVRYVHNLPFYGVAVACIDHPVVAELLSQFARRTLTYGLSAGADIRADNLRITPEGMVFDLETSAALAHYPDRVKDVRLSMFGAYNVQNALAALAVAHEINVPFDRALHALATFQGVGRRFNVTGIVDGVTVVDDYAHHPAEIRAVLGVGRALAGQNGGKLVAIWQPHRYSRTADLWAEFCACFADADIVVVADIYAAGEMPVAGVTQARLVEEIAATGIQQVLALRDAADLPALVREITSAGDYVVCHGAGSVTHWAQGLPAALEVLSGAHKTASGG